MGRLKRGISILFLLMSANFAFAQAYDQKVADYILKVEHPLTFLQKIEKFGIKEPGKKGLDSTFFWLKELIDKDGYKTVTQNFVYGTDTLRNLLFSKKGDIDSCIIIGAHYDSKIGAGVNDNGTGNFALYQIAKLLKPLQTKYTVRFVFFSGEEIDYLGSRYFVKTLNKDLVKIKFMLNLDQLGGTKDQDNTGIKCERDEVSSKKVESNLLAESMSKIYSFYTNLNPVITPAYSSDYLPFRDSGYLISGIYQYSSFPYYHSKNDLLRYIEFNSLVSTTKGAVAFVLYHSQSQIISGIFANRPKSQNLNVYFTGNAFVIAGNETYEFSVFDNLGREISIEKELISDNKVSVQQLKGGMYYANFKTKTQSINIKFFVQP